MKFYGELLIFVLLFIINLRVFFVNSVKRDPIVAFAPVAFILAIIQIFSWGLDLFTILGVILSFLVLLSNFHALFRYTERLYVDHYSVLMKIWAVFTNLMSLGAIVCLIIFAPIELKKKPFDITENKYRYSGNFSTGFEPASAFGKVSATLYEYKKSEEMKKLHKDDDDKIISVAEETPTDILPKNIVLFIPDKRGDTYNYEPYLKLLAVSSKDFIVLSCDFFADDCRWFHSFADSKIMRNFAMIVSSINNPHKFSASRELYTYNIYRECEQLISMIHEKYGEDSKIFIISDGMGNDGVSDYIKKNGNVITGHLKLNDFPEYKSAGYGFIAETNPLLNAYLGLPKERKFETPKLLVEKTKEVIKF